MPARKSPLTQAQQKLRPAEYEAEVRHLRYKARLAHLDDRAAHSKRFHRQADYLEKLMTAFLKKAA